MKHLQNFFAICAVLFFSFSSLPVKADVEASIGVNFSELDNYGEWIHIRGLGKVWRPDAETGWRPFMYGHWASTDDGWLWDSDEPFGWIVCHYGNWYNDEDQGWVWIPGYEWSPARVNWYVTDNEIGWAPLYPPGHHDRFAREHWMFCPTTNFTSVEVRSHASFRLHPERGEARVKVYAGAPRIDFIQRFIQGPVVHVTTNKVRISNREHPLFRIEINGGHHERVEVPIGPRFRRTEVRVEPEHRSHEVIVRHEESRQSAQPAESERRVIVRPSRSDEPENRVRVEIGNDRRNNRGDDERDTRNRHDRSTGVKVEINGR